MIVKSNADKLFVFRPRTASVPRPRRRGSHGGTVRVMFYDAVSVRRNSGVATPTSGPGTVRNGRRVGVKPNPRARFYFAVIVYIYALYCCRATVRSLLRFWCREMSIKNIPCTVYWWGWEGRMVANSARIFAVFYSIRGSLVTRPPATRT